MGNRMPNYNKAIGVKAECPICGLQFRKEDTHGHVCISFLAFYPALQTFLKSSYNLDFLTSSLSMIDILTMISAIGKWSHRSVHD